MWQYTLRRILLFIPVMFAISLLAFVILVNAPGDPVQRLMRVATVEGGVQASSANLVELQRFWRHKLGLDLPVFYVAISNLASPDTLHRIEDRREKEALELLLHRHGNWEALQEYRVRLKALNADVSRQLEGSGLSEGEAIREAVRLATSLAWNPNLTVVQKRIDRIDSLLQSAGTTSTTLPLVRTALDGIEANPSTWKNYIPVLHWHGNNQYHRWLFGDGYWLTGNGAVNTQGVIRGDFGISYHRGQRISDLIGERVFWSLMIAVISIFLAYAISLPIGIRAAVHRDSWFDRGSGVLLFLLYAMPSFWVAVVLMMIFANPDALGWLPSSGVKPVEGYPEGTSVWGKISTSMPYLILPVICYTYGAWAFLSRTMRTAMLEVLAADYVRTARAKGLSERAVVYKHALRNALFPLITVFANVFPLALGGSVILESIFSIPGMGSEIYRAILNKDYPMVVAVFTLTGLLTMIGYLVADILYAWADPRVSYRKTGKR